MPATSLIVSNNHVPGRPRAVCFGALLAALIASDGAAQLPTVEQPRGERLLARDGDVVVVEHGARVLVVQRREGQVRAVFNAAERWLLLLIDHADTSPASDGIVDEVHYYTGVSGTWPLAGKWDGAATFETYSSVGNGTPNRGAGLVTPQGFIRIRGLVDDDLPTPDAIAVVAYSGGGSRGTSSMSLDEAQAWYAKELGFNDGTMRFPYGSGSVSSRVEGGVRGGSSVDVARGVARVGGPIKQPVKIADVKPVLPDAAARAGVRGTVLIEITIDVDGKVVDGRVLRSIPLLDAAALEAVRQWRYEPTTYLGKPLALVMTVPVNVD